MTRYTDEQKTEALRIFELEGATQAAQTIGCTRNTIYVWLKEAARNKTTKTKEQLAEEADTDNRYQTHLRTTLRRRLLGIAHSVLDRIDEPHIDFKTTKDGVVQVEYPSARSGDVKNYVTSAAILLDKYRLEMGESTDRVEQAGSLEVRINGVDPTDVK